MSAGLGRRSPILPVRTSSRTPYGRTSSSNASTWSGRPTTSNVIASRPMSATTRARDLAERDELGTAVGRDADGEERELALERVVGPELGDAQHVHELVHLLLDLLERVLAAVDAEREPRDVGSLSVGPTARLWML